MEVFMNRNFAKISVVIVALVLALAFCLTGCKVDDVAADLGTTKDEVSANKADAAKALEDAVKALEAKIAANEADCAAEIAAVNAAVKAAKDAGAATEASLAAAEKALNDAINAVRASLDATKKELSDKITANDAKINAEVAALNAAIENAEAALKAAGAADKAALESSLAAAKAELEAAVALLKADISKLTEYVNSAVADLKADIAADKKDLTESLVALENALTIAKGELADANAANKAELEQAITDATQAVIEVVELSDAALQALIDSNAWDIDMAEMAIESAQAAIDLINSTLDELKGVDAGLADKIAVLQQMVNDYNAATEAVDKAWSEIFATYNTWVELSVDYNATAEVKATVSEAYGLAQILLGRALTTDEVDTIKKDFFEVVNAAINSTNEGHKAAYDKLVAAEAELAKEDTDLAAVRAILDEVRAYLATVNTDTMLVDGAVVDLSDKYDADCKTYNAERIAVLNAAVEAIKTNIAAAEDTTAAEANDAAIAEVKKVIDAYIADEDIPFAAEEEAAFNAAHIELLRLVAHRVLDLTEAVVRGSAVDTIRNNSTMAKDKVNAVAISEECRINVIKNLGGETEDLVAKAVKVSASIVETYMGLAKASTEAATDAATLGAAEELIATGASKIADVKDDATVAALEALVAETYATYYAKCVDIYAAQITAKMNGYIDNLAAIYAEVTAGTTNIADIRAEYLALIDNRNYAEALHGDSEVVAALVAAETAFVKVEAQYAELTALVAEAGDVANILVNDAFTTIEGVNAEYVVLDKYNTTATAWVERLDKLGFSEEANAEAYNTIRALINEAKYNEIKAAFEAKIAHLVGLATEVIEDIKKINANVEQNGYSFGLIKEIEAAWAAYRTWEQNATDADGVGFIIAYVSNGEYTNENLNTVLSTIQTEYDAYVKGAQEAWADCNTDHYQDLTVDNIKWTETALTAVREWFTKYGTTAADYNVANVGTADDEADLVVLENKLAELKANRKALVEQLAAEADELQAAINELGFVTTDSAAAVKALREAVEAWEQTVAENAIDFVAEFGKAVAIDDTALVAAEDKLVDLAAQVENIKNLINALVIPTMGDDIAAPYFADVDAKDAYVAAVKDITDAIAKFNTDNDGNRNCISEEELAKVTAANSELYVTKYEAALKVYNAYVETINGVSDEEVLAIMATYLNEARREISVAGAENLAYIAQIGTNAEKKLNDIKEGNGLPVCQEHTYDNNCDPVCNVCFYTRTPSDHVYSDECDEKCDECDAGRVAPHLWENACDTKCDCGKTRTITHDYDTGICTVCGAIDPNHYFVVTIPEALAKADGAKVQITGVVISTEAWNTKYKNMSVTIKDENGNTIYVFRLGTQVGLGDTITIKGVVGSYNGDKQIAQGATAVIDVVHGDNHTYEGGVCTVCGSKEPVAGQETIKVDFSTVSGTQYVDETKTFGEDISVSTHNEGCHFNTQLRIYDSSSNNGYAVITSTGVVSELKFNMGYKKATLEVYGSTDGVTWTLISKVATTSTSYLDYTLDVDETLGYKYIKIDAVGAQIRVASIDVTILK